MTLLNIEEILAKTGPQRKAIEEQMDKSGHKGGFHPEEASIYKGQGKADFADIKETLHSISLKQLMEYLGPSSTTGIAGAAYLIPDKLWDICATAARNTDIVPSVSRMLDTPGSHLDLDIEKDGQFNPKWFSSGGEMPTETMEFVQSTITPKTYGIRPEITQDLIEDSNWDVVQMHLETASRAIGEFSTDIWCGIVVAEYLSAGTSNGDGTINSVNSGGDYVYVNDLFEAETANYADGYRSEYIVAPPHFWQTFATGQNTSPDTYSSGFHDMVMSSNPMDLQTVLGMKVYRIIHATTSNSSLYSASKWQTIVANREWFTATVRKRWLKLENYSDPIRDLKGATISCREGHSFIYKDAGCVIHMDSS
jgi:hypothetical protein